MAIHTQDERVLDPTRVLPTANDWKILGFEVRTDSEEPLDDRLFVRKEARRIVSETIVDRMSLRGTAYTTETMQPLLGDVGRRFLAALGLDVDADDAAVSFALYCALRDGLYAAEQASGEFPADAT